MIRVAESADASDIARLHAQITTGFLPTLGQAFLRRLYVALIAWPDADVLVADEGRGSIGFVASVTDTGAFYKHFVMRHGVLAGLAALPRMVRPTGIRQAIETFRHGTNGEESVADAELFSLATDAESRGRGLGTALVEALIVKFRERGLRSVRVVIGGDNQASLALHRRAGFVDHSTIEVHKGEASKVLVWSA